MFSSKNLRELLESEINEVVGCTEPASVAFAFAHAKEIFLNKTEREKFPSDFKAKVLVSRDVSRNISTVKIPVMKIKGVEAAAASGIYTKSSEFNPFAGLGKKEKLKIKALLNRKNWLKVSVKDIDGIFVDVRVISGGKTARVIVEGRHDNIKSIYFGDRKIIDEKKDTVYKIKSMGEIMDIVFQRNRELEDIVEKFIQAEGLLYEKFYYTDIFEGVKGLVKKRMEGASLKVITVTGSGNQGIFLAIPFYVLYKKLGKKILPSVLFAVLTQIYLTNSKGRISGDCGLASKAAPSLAAGLSLFNELSLEKIRDNMLLIFKSLKGLKCEGAEPVCAIKAQLALMAVKNVVGQKERGLL